MLKENLQGDADGEGWGGLDDRTGRSLCSVFSGFSNKWNKSLKWRQSED